MMNLLTISRSMAKLEYTAARLPLTLLDERIVARYWHDQGLFRIGFQRFLGSADELARVAPCRSGHLRAGPGTDAAYLAPGGG